MQILCLGVSHHTAPVELRERLNYPPPALQAALARVGCGRDARPPALAELAILSTCNRLELYAAAPPDKQDTALAAMTRFLAETRDVPVSAIEAHAYQYQAARAVIHLCRVAAGLDSLVLGEPQILGQVAQAYEAAARQGAAGHILSVLFRTAIRAGKRARAETAISRNPASVGSMAVKLAGAVVGDLPAARVAVLGAGEMAALAVEALRARGVRRVDVVNRTRDRAAQLAERWDARALTFEQLDEALAAADIVIASTAAPHIIVTPEAARAALDRAGRPLVFIDIAVPRNVSPEVAQLPGVHYFDIDDLQSHLHGALAARASEIPQVEAIAAEEAGAFLDWLPGLDVVALVADLRAQADAVRRAEVEKTLRRLPNLSASDRQRIEALSEALVNKLLHAPTLRLKAEAGNGHIADVAAAARYLFALDS